VVGVRTSNAEVRAMLNGLTSTGQLEQAVALLTSYLALCGSMVGRVRDAEGLCSIVINGCAEAGRMDLSKRVLGSMRQVAVPLGCLTFCILIKGYGRAGDVRRVAETYSAMKNWGVKPDLATLNSLLDAYARNGKVVSAEAVLKEMAAYAVTPSTRSFNTLIKGYTRAGRLREAFSVVRRMRETLGASGPNEITYSTLIHGLVRAGELRRARQILSWMSDTAKHIEPDVFAYTALMKGLLLAPNGGPKPVYVAGAGRLVPAHADGVPSTPAEAVSEVLGLLDTMIERGVRPNAATISTVINGCFDLGDVNAARTAAAVVRALAEGLGDEYLAVACDSALISGLCRGQSAPGSEDRERDRSNLRSALRLFVKGCTTAAARGATTGTRRGKDPLICVRTCNALLSSLVSFGELGGATRVLEAMDSGAASKANGYTLCMMMQAHGHRRQFAEAEALWTRLSERRWVDTVALNTWLQVCMGCGQQRRALQSFQTAKVDMPNVKLDLVTFGTLINGLTGNTGGTRQAARRALQLWAEMRAAKIWPDDGVVTSLMAAIVRHFDIEVALELRVELIAMGWTAERLRRYDMKLRHLLPPLAEVMGDIHKWEALGVKPSADIISEQVQLVLPQTTMVSQEEAHAALASVAQASASEEIWERKGWNRIQSGWSGWPGFF
jgi:pentatricopeptide repeat protein